MAPYGDEQELQHGVDAPWRLATAGSHDFMPYTRLPIPKLAKRKPVRNACRVNGRRSVRNMGIRA
jgi:hypothetical protein